MIKWPEHLKAEMPLPDKHRWVDETHSHYAGLRDENDNSFAWVRRNNIVFWCPDATIPFTNIEDAMRLIYAKFLFRDSQ
jgi:hypothetical protein